jgi:hypothetical protein
MKHLLPVLCLLLCHCASAQSTSLAIRNVNVVGVTDGLLLVDHTVLVSATRIVAVGATTEVQVPDHAELLEGAERFQSTVTSPSG